MRAVHYLFIIFVMINVISFSLYGIDKRRAKQSRWRIRESVLLGATWLMGGVGAFAGMQLFRHKTQHKAFVISAPVAAVLQLALMLFATLRLTGLI